MSTTPPPLRVLKNIRSKTAAKPPASEPDPIPIDHLRARHPRRPVDWRWRLAHELFRLNKSSSQTGDADVDSLVAYFRAWHSDPGRSVQCWPAFAEALNLRDGESATEVMRRVDLEAYIIAGEPDTALARRFGIGLKVVQAYESVLFDVRDRLHDACEIVASFMGPADLPLAEDNWPVLTRLLGFHCNTILLDAYLEYRCNPRPSMPRSLVRMTSIELKNLSRQLYLRYCVLKTLPDVRPKNLQHWTNIGILAASLIVRLSGSAEARAFQGKKTGEKGTCYFVQRNVTDTPRPLFFGSRRSVPATIVDIILDVRVINDELLDRQISGRVGPDDLDCWTWLIPNYLPHLDLTVHPTGTARHR